MHTFGFYGLGLIGGSIAKTLRRVRPDCQILASNRSSAPLLKAKEEGVVDEICAANDPRLASCDLLFLCAPVEVNVAYLTWIKDHLGKNTILTDVGSVKGPTHKAIEELGLGGSFIGGHPMAGSEKTGYENSSDRLVENAYYIITPGGEVGIEALSDFTQLVDDLGAIPLVLTSEEHDYVTAGVSHLPHLIASSLVNLVKDLDGEQQYMKMIAAGGFRDITRIASSSPTMWQQICEENQANISSVLDDYIRALIQIRYQIDEGNSQFVYDMFASSKEYRDSIDVPDAGPLRRTHALYVDLVDEAGGIATVTTILAMDGINIKDLGIIHNREFDDGVLKLEFYDRESLERSLGLLQKRNYHVRERGE